MSRAVESRAEAVRPPEPGRALAEARAEQQRRRGVGEALERHSVMRGLIVLAVLALFGSMVRAGWDRVFVHGWWRQW